MLYQKLPITGLYHICQNKPRFREKRHVFENVLNYIDGKKDTLNTLSILEYSKMVLYDFLAKHRKNLVLSAIILTEYGHFQNIFQVSPGIFQQAITMNTSE